MSESNAMSSADQGKSERIKGCDIRLLSYWFAGCAAVTVIMAMMFLRPVLSGNDGSRWNTVWSITHAKGYVIDGAPYDTQDKVKRDGHFYSSKPPIYPTLIAGIVFGIRGITGLDLPKDEVVIIRLVLVMVNVIPLALLIVLYGRILEQQKVTGNTAAICLVTASWGTYLTSYSVSLNNHTPAAIGCFLTLYHLIAIIYQGKAEWWRYSLCGVFASWTVCSELPSAVFGLITFIWAFRHNGKAAVKYFALPAAIVFLLYFLTTWISTGSFIPNYVRFNSPLYFYPGSYWVNPTGIDAARDSKLFYLFNLTFGHHGLFSLSPFILLSIYGLTVNKDWRGVHRLGLLLASGLLLLYLFKSNNYGGECDGPRWFIWLIPFWIIALGPVIESKIENGWFRSCCYVFVGVSIVSSMLAMSSPSGPWGTSWMHSFMRAQGWISY